MPAGKERPTCVVQHNRKDQKGLTHDSEGSRGASNEEKEKGACCTEVIEYERENRQLQDILTQALDAIEDFKTKYEWAVKQAKCLEPLAFHVKEGMEKVATVPAKVAQRKLTILEGKLCEQDVDAAKSAVAKLEASKKLLLMALRLDVAEQERERLAQTSDVLKQELKDTYEALDEWQEYAEGLGHQVESLREAVANKEVELELTLADMDAAEVRHAQELEKALSSADAGHTSRLQEALARADEKRSQDVREAVAAAQEKYTRELEALKAAHRDALEGARQQQRDLEQQVKRASERAEHAERSMLLLEQRLMEKDSFLQEWKRMAAEQKGIESERLQEHIKAMSEKERLGEARLMERITGLEEQLRSEQRARQEARDRVRELEAELRASTLEGRAQVTALTAEVRAKDRRVSLLEDELGALHVPRAADRRLLGRGAPGGVPSTIEESREESAGPARPQGGSSGERRAGLALGDFLSGAVTGRGEARRQGLSKRGAKGAQRGRRKGPGVEDSSASGDSKKDPVLASAPRIDIDKPFEPPTGDDAEDAEEASQAASPSPKKGGRKRVAGAKRSGAENVKGKGGEKKRRKAGAPERGELEIGADHPSQSNGEDAAKGTGKVPGKKRILGRPAGALSQLDINRPSVINPRAISSAKARAPLASQMAKDDTVQGVVAQARESGGAAPPRPAPASNAGVSDTETLPIAKQVPTGSGFMFGGTFAAPTLGKRG